MRSKDAADDVDFGRCAKEDFGEFNGVRVEVVLDQLDIPRRYGKVGLKSQEELPVGVCHFVGQHVH